MASAERVQPVGSLRQGLLPKTELGLQRDAAPDLELAGLILGSPDHVLALLGEPSVLLRAVPKRRAEFVAGRHAAALALSRFGGVERVDRGARGEPLWPAGFVGSISHGAGLAVAVVSSSRDYRGLGIDVERWMSDQECAEVSERVLHPLELEMLGHALPALSAASCVSLGFSLKESLYKCLNPLAEEFIEFDDARLCRVVPCTPTSGRVWLSLARSFSDELLEGTQVPGCYALEPGRVETLVWLPWRHS